MGRIECEGDNIVDIWNDYNGQLTNVEWSSDTPNKLPNYSLNFDNNGKIIIGNIDEYNMGSGDFTICIWVKSTESLSSDSFCTMILTHGATRNNEGDFAFYLDDTDGWRFITNETNLTSDNNVSTNKWTFLAIIRKSGVWYRGFEDSPVSSMNTGSGSENIMQSDEEFCIGTDIDEGSGNDWNGKIYDPTIYSSALSESQLSDIRTGND